MDYKALFDYLPKLGDLVLSYLAPIERFIERWVQDYPIVSISISSTGDICLVHAHPKDYDYISELCFLRIVNREGKQLRAWKASRVWEGRFFIPSRAAFLPDGNLFVIIDKIIRVYSPQGKVIKEREYRDFHWYPGSIAISPRGHVYVSDPINGYIRIFNFQVDLLFSWGKGKYDKGGQLACPDGLALIIEESSEEIYICDSNKHQIQIFRVEMKDNEFEITFLRKWGGHNCIFSPKDGLFNFPQGIAIHRNEIYVVDHRCAQVFTPEGVFKRTFRSSIGGYRSFHSLAIHDGRLYAVNDHVHVFDLLD